MSMQVSRWFRIALVAAFVLALYSPVLWDLAKDWWNEPSLTYGLLIPPLALSLAWFRRGVTFRQPGEEAWGGLVVTLGACLLLLLGRLGAEFFLSRISFVVLLIGLTWTFWGRARLKTLAFPFLLLATMVPLPSIVYNALASPLQLLASDVSTRMVQAAGVSVFRDGNLLYLANTTLGVEEACSGLSSLTTLVVVSLLLGFLNCQSLAGRWILFALAIPTAIAANVLRVAGTALLADYDPGLAMGFYHLFSGWLTFVIGFGALYGMTRVASVLGGRQQ